MPDEPDPAASRRPLRAHRRRGVLLQRPRQLCHARPGRPVPRGRLLPAPIRRWHRRRRTGRGRGQPRRPPPRHAPGHHPRRAGSGVAPRWAAGGRAGSRRTGALPRNPGLPGDVPGAAVPRLRRHPRRPRAAGGTGRSPSGPRLGGCCAPVSVSSWWPRPTPTISAPWPRATPGSGSCPGARGPISPGCCRASILRPGCSSPRTNSLPRRSPNCPPVAARSLAGWARTWRSSAPRSNRAPAGQGSRPSGPGRPPGAAGTGRTSWSDRVAICWRGRWRATSPSMPSLGSTRGSCT